jgi:predicted DNA-binding transcriptional regulator YafY
VDHHGSTSERVVDPVRVEGGWLTAYDHRSGEVRSFAAHRITGVAQAEPSRA